MTSTLAGGQEDVHPIRAIQKEDDMNIMTTNRAAFSAVSVAVAAMIAVFIRTGGETASAQQAGQTARQPATADTKKVLLDPADTVILLLDHQNGLFQTVKDVPVAELRTNAVILAKLAKLAKIPLITTASVPEGPNGPLMHELKE